MSWYIKAEDNESQSWVGAIESLPEDDPQKKAMKDFGKRLEVLRSTAQTIALELFHRYESTDGVIPALLKIFENATLRVPGLGKENTRKVQQIATTVVEKLRRKYRGQCKYLFPFIAEVIKSKGEAPAVTEE